MTNWKSIDSGDVEYCESCNGPNHGRSKLELAFSHVAHWVFMRLPIRLMSGKFGLAILPYAGNIAFGCHCWGKNARARMSPPPTTKPEV